MIQTTDSPTVLSYIGQLDAVAARDWQPGDPLYPPPDVSYSIPATTYGPCPPRCWCHAATGFGGHAMRWTPDTAPVLRFKPYGGLHVAGNAPRPRLAELLPWERRRVCTC